MPLTLNVISLERPNADGIVTRISTAANGSEANAKSFDGRLSTDGHYAFFSSDATNLAGGPVTFGGSLFRKDLQTGAVELITVGFDGSTANNSSGNFTISADGSRMVFNSLAGNLVQGDGNIIRDIFVKTFGVPGLVSLTLNANDSSFLPSISANGQFVVFESYASNLITNDTDTAGSLDVFIKDLSGGSLKRLPGIPDGRDYQISSDGKFLTFTSGAALVANDGNQNYDIYRMDLTSRTYELLSVNSQGQVGLDGGSTHAKFSADGNYMVFESQARNMAVGDTNFTSDIFRKDMRTGAVILVSVAGSNPGNNGSTDAQISADGRFVTFRSYSTNFVAGDNNKSVDVFRKDMVTGAIERISTSIIPADGKVQGNGDSSASQVSRDGRFLTFISSASNLVPGNESYGFNAFRKDLMTGDVTRVSVIETAETLGGTDNAQVSGDGRFVAFDSSTSLSPTASALRDVYVRDMASGAITHVSATADGGTGGDGQSREARISTDGRRAAFESSAKNLVAGDTKGKSDIFLRDMSLQAHTLTRVSTGLGGEEANGDSYEPDLSADGNLVVFRSFATNLVAADTNGTSDIFLKDIRKPNDAPIRISVTKDGSEANGLNGDANINVRGPAIDVVFTSYATNILGPGIDRNGWADVFVYRQDGSGFSVVRASSRAGGQDANGASIQAQVSADGRYVVFTSDATDLVAGDLNKHKDIFVTDLDHLDLAPVLVSNGSNGQANGDSTEGQISADGRYVTFTSNATNLVAGDRNDRADIFRKDLQTGIVERLSVSAADAQGLEQSTRDSLSAGLSGDGRFVVVESATSNLVAGDTNQVGDLFLVDAERVHDILARNEGRFVELKLGIGAGTLLDIAWGDGMSETVQAAGGVAALSHAYATKGIKDAVVTVHEGIQTWSVHQSLDVAGGTLVRNTALADTLSGGDAADTLTGDGFANVLVGKGGNDTLSGAVGADNLMGDDGTDTLDGGADGDTLSGGAGDDALDGGSGSDTLNGGAGADTLSGGADGDGLSGGVGDDTLTGAAGADKLMGEDGNDSLDGGADGDSLDGGAGSDALDGGAGADSLDGGAGNDALDGGAGADRMTGGAGDDTYRVDDAGDVIVEAAGGGADTAIVSLDFNMGALANVETIKLADGSVAARVTGGAGNDHLIGNTNFNIIDGAGGADTMEGGAGSDVFLVDNAADLVVEAAGGGQDAVQAGVSYALSAGAEIETLTALGSGAIALTGSDSANTIHGNAGANILAGQGGNDAMDGGLGVDRLDGGLGDDIVRGGLGRDELWGGIGRDTFVFDTRPNTRANLDKVRDFSVRDDSIWLDNGVMTKLGRRGSESNPVKLNKAFFATDSAKDGNDYVIYKKSTGVLYYDPDGNGAKAAVQLATLNKNLKIKATDFFVV